MKGVIRFLERLAARKAYRKRTMLLYRMNYIFNLEDEFPKYNKDKKALGEFEKYIC